MSGNVPSGMRIQRKAIKLSRKVSEETVWFSDLNFLLRHCIGQGHYYAFIHESRSALFAQVCRSKYVRGKYGKKK